MNKKNKVLLSAAAMLVLTGAAASASTFAWFTTVRNASVNYSQATVYTDSGNLSVALASSLSTLTDSGTGTALVLTGSNRITDISGEGSAFYKPVWNSADTNGTTADSISTIAVSGAGAADGFYVDFTLTIAQSNTDVGSDGMNVYLGGNTKINPVTPANSQDVQAANSARLAVLHAGTTQFVWAPESGDASYRYVSTGLPADSAYTVAGYKLNTQVAATALNDEFFVGAMSTYTTVAAAEAAFVSPIATLSPSSPSMEVTFRSWIEGTDADCINSAIGGIFSITLDLYGIAV